MEKIYLSRIRVEDCQSILTQCLQDQKEIKIPFAKAWNKYMGRFYPKHLNT